MAISKNKNALIIILSDCFFEFSNQPKIPVSAASLEVGQICRRNPHSVGGKTLQDASRFSEVPQDFGCFFVLRFVHLRRIIS